MSILGQAELLEILNVKPKISILQQSCGQKLIIYLLIFGNCFIQVRVRVDSEPILGTLDRRQEYTIEGMQWEEYKVKWDLLVLEFHHRHCNEIAVIHRDAGLRKK